jgi:hypothetical protein
MDNVDTVDTELPLHPNISQLKRQAKDLKQQVRSGESEAQNRAGVSAGDAERFGLRQAQAVIAREHGFDAWHDLVEEVGERMVDQRELHRWFGVNLNNRTWAALDAGDVDAGSPAVDRERLLYGAYASAYHWLEAGTPIHQARAEHLIARTALRVGRPDVALDHARRCLELIDAHPDLAEDWDAGFALEALARALAATGDVEAAQATRVRAKAAAASVADPEERAVVESELGRGEWFGLL